MPAQERIKKLVEENPVMLFMKGEPMAPQCGFSARVVQLLEAVGARYKTFDVLRDEEVRQGVKAYADWPTIPQLYVRGEFWGGCDIVEEKFGSGELEKQLAFSKKTEKSQKKTWKKSWKKKKLLNKIRRLSDKSS